MAIHYFGIRHHGPGSARHLLAELEKLCPDIVLIEGPLEMEAMLPALESEDLVPPIAFLGYRTDELRHSVFYPFAVFSPEWQAMQYARRAGKPIRFIDLPIAHQRFEEVELRASDTNETAEEEVCEAESSEEEIDEIVLNEAEYIRIAPLDYIAELAGYEEGEAWWEHQIEHRREGEGVFEAVSLMMTELRQAIPSATRESDLVREAYMRRRLRETVKEGYECIAVVCGAWHIPALESYTSHKAKDDNELLKGLSKHKIQGTWIPWTYSRLGTSSGYGAGINSPAWYDYLWEHPDDDGILFLSRVAALLREHGKDISVAHVIETQRLAQVSAALRGRYRPSLTEYREAIVAVMGFGDDNILELVHQYLVVGNKIGSVPSDSPKVPLMQDLESLQRRLRMPFSDAIKTLTLDLRKPNDLERSTLLHRLSLLGIDWGAREYSGGKGTFKETWTLYYKPELLITIIERAVWGGSVKEATEQYLKHICQTADSITSLSELLERVLPADLPLVVELIAQRLEDLSAGSTDTLQMMGALPSLVEVVRYGNVRAIDYSHIKAIIAVLVARITAGGLVSASNINYEAASSYQEKLSAAYNSLNILSDDTLSTEWLSFIKEIADSEAVHPLLRGYSTRALHSSDILDSEAVAEVLSRYTSRALLPLDIAYWLEGFLAGSAQVLLIDDLLWGLSNNWVLGLSKEHFDELLPVLRRTFGNYTSAERRQIAERAKEGNKTNEVRQVVSTVSHLATEDAEQSIAMIELLLGLHQHNN